MVALFRTVVGVSLVGGLLVVLLWTEHQVDVKTPAHIHFQAHARAIPEAAAPGTALDKAASQAGTRKSVQLQSPRGASNTPGDPHHNTTTRPPPAPAPPQPHPPASPQPLTPTTHAQAPAPAHNPQAPAQVVVKRERTGGSAAPTPATPTIYVITPTYRRPEQVAELTRLAQTLMLVPSLHWLVVEDAVAPTRRVLAFLDTCTVPHTYLLGTASRRYKGANKPRGVSNRNAGLKWLKVHAKEGVIYFADDDNTYDYRIFHEIRHTRQVSMFPVGLVTRLGVSSPIVSNGKLVGFYDGWVAGRKFPIDMAGFAVNVQFYLQRNAPMMPYNVGFEEDGFLKALKINPEDIEPLADNCTKILVWHTRTVKSLPALKMPDNDRVSKTNLHHLKSQIVFQLPHGIS